MDTSKTSEQPEERQMTEVSPSEMSTQQTETVSSSSPILPFPVKFKETMAERSETTAQHTETILEETQFAVRRNKARFQHTDVEFQPTETMIEENAKSFSLEMTNADSKTSREGKYKQLGPIDPEKPVGAWVSLDHNNWQKVSVHTAVCDKCKINNYSVVQRCGDCNLQLCEQCFPNWVGEGKHVFVDAKSLDWIPEPSRGGGRSKGKTSSKTPTPKRARKQPMSGEKNISKVAKSTPKRTPRFNPANSSQLARTLDEDCDSDEVSRTRVAQSTLTRAPGHYQGQVPQHVQDYEDGYADREYYASRPLYSPVEEQYYRDESDGYAGQMYSRNDRPPYGPLRPAPVHESNFRIPKKPGTSIRESARSYTSAEGVRHGLSDPVLPPPGNFYDARRQRPMNEDYYVSEGSRQDYGSGRDYNVRFPKDDQEVSYGGTQFSTDVRNEAVQPTSHYLEYAFRSNNSFEEEQYLGRPDLVRSAQVYATAASPSPNERRPAGVRHRVSFDLSNDENAARRNPEYGSLPTSVSPAAPNLTTEEREQRQAKIQELKVLCFSTESIKKLLDEDKLEEAEDYVEAARALMRQHNGA